MTTLLDPNSITRESPTRHKQVSKLILSFLLSRLIPIETLAPDPTSHNLTLELELGLRTPSHSPKHGQKGSEGILANRAPQFHEKVEETRVFL